MQKAKKRGGGGSMQPLVRGGPAPRKDRRLRETGIATSPAQAMPSQRRVLLMAVLAAGATVCTYYFVMTAKKVVTSQAGDQNHDVPVRTNDKVAKRKTRRSEQDIATYGLKLMLSGRYDLGLQEFRNGLLVYPTSSLLALNVADAYAFQNLYEQALLAYHAALEIAQREQQSLSSRGSNGEELTPTPIFKEPGKQKASSESHITKALTWIGVCHRRLGHSGDAIEWLTKAVHHNRKAEKVQTRECRYHLAYSYYQDDRFVDAAKWMGETMKISMVADDFQLAFVLLGALEHWELLALLLNAYLGGDFDFTKDYTRRLALVHYAAALSMSRRENDFLSVVQQVVELDGSSTEQVKHDIQTNLDLLLQKAADVKDIPRDKNVLHSLHRELTELYEPLYQKAKGKVSAWSLISKRHVLRFQWPLPSELVEQARRTMEAQTQALDAGEDLTTPIFDDIVEVFSCLTIPIFDLKDCVVSAKVHAGRRAVAIQRDGVRLTGYHDFDRGNFPALTPSQPLRIGLFSADVRTHPMLSLVYAFVRRTRSMPDVRVTLYHASADPVVLDLISTFVDGTQSCTKANYTDCLQQARQSKVQVWLETTGSTGEGINSLVQSGPAPVGVLWAGFPGSLAMPSSLQYMVSDTYTVPPDSAISEQYPEKMLYVPGSWMISDTKNLDDEMELIQATLTNTTHTRESLREQFGIPLDAVVFSYFGRTFKIDDRLFGAWGRIIEQVPRSCLVVAYYSTDASLDPSYILKNMKSAWEGMRLPPDRFVAVPPFRRGEHVQVMRAMSDVSLDTITYGGGTTGFEALYAGLPLVHFSGGDKMMQRAGGSLLAASGLHELVAKDLDDYIRIAVRLGSDPAYRQSIVQHLEDMRFRRKPSIIFQPEMAIDAMVRGLKKAYELWKQGKPPQTISYDKVDSEEADDAGLFRSSEL